MADAAPAHIAGAAAFDAAVQRIGEVSAASFERDGVEDLRAMAEVLHVALKVAMAGDPQYRLGFLLPLVDALECQRMGLTNSDAWTGAVLVQDLMQTRRAAGPAEALPA